MTVMVTGVAGFVGSALARRLLADGEQVVGVDALTDYYDPALKKANLATIPQEGFTFVEGDLNALDLDALLDGVVVVFHEAGQPGVRASWGDDFATYVNANVLATQRLLEAARRAPALRRLVYASSSSVYGNALAYPTTEDDLPRPHSPYGVTKLAGEHLCTLYARNFDVPTVSLRYFTVYGPGQRPDMAFTVFIRAAQAGRPMEVFGSGQQVRDFTFVDDVVDANLRAAVGDVAPGSVFNVSGERASASTRSSTSSPTSRVASWRSRERLRSLATSGKPVDQPSGSGSRWAGVRRWTSPQGCAPSGIRWPSAERRRGSSRRGPGIRYWRARHEHARDGVGRCALNAFSTARSSGWSLRFSPSQVHEKTRAPHQSDRRHWSSICWSSRAVGQRRERRRRPARWRRSA